MSAFAAGAAKAPQHSVEHRMDAGLDEKFYETTRIEHVDTYVTTFEQEARPNEKGNMYQDGKLVLLPAPTRDPRDPLNMTKKHKYLCAFFLCFFGALAAAAELILGAMLPVFSVEYSGYDPKLLLMWSEIDALFVPGQDPLKLLAHLSDKSPPIVMIYLLASLPVLIIGVANLLLIPLAISVGRRAIVLVCGVLAICGCLWAGFSQSLGSHLAARAVQAIGAGTVESLIPFVIQDMCFFHERNTWISFVFAAQGLIIIGIGFASPHIIINLTWRWVYYMTAAGAAFFLVGVFFTLPETRYQRTHDEMAGIPRDDEGVDYAPRTFKSDLAWFTGGLEFRKGWLALLASLKTFFYPQIFFITMLNSIMIASALAAAYTVAPALLAPPWRWKFLNLGYCLVAVLIGALFVPIVTGSLADYLVNYMAKKRGRREPENQLINLVLPTLLSIVGAILYGYIADHTYQFHWSIFLMTLAFMVFGFLGSNTVGAVYVLESYPHLAGPALVNIASFRCLIAFVLSFYVSEWIEAKGHMTVMLIYAGVMIAFALPLPFLYYYGPAWRKRWPATHLGGVLM